MGIRHHIDHFLLRAGRRLSLRRVWAFPEVLQVAPTNACNLRCLNCVKTHAATDNRHMNPDVYEQVRKHLFPHARFLNLVGLGEPLLSPLFPQMLEDATEYGLAVHFVTNATLLDGPMIQRIVRAGADMTVSLDGATAETHERSRPGSQFSQVLDAFGRFQAEKKARADSLCHLNISTVVNRLNLDEIDGILGIAAKHGVSTVALISPGVGDRTDAFAQEAIGKFPNLFASRIAGLVERARSLGVRLAYPELPPLSPAAGEDPETGRAPGESVRAGTLALRPTAPVTRPTAPGARLFAGRCLDPWNMVYIDVDGWVRPCCRAIWLGMGNVLMQDFGDIWNGEHYRNLRGCINSNNPPEFCRTCNVNTGINRGDERHIETLKAKGIALPEPPRIGIT